MMAGSVSLSTQPCMDFVMESRAENKLPAGFNTSFSSAYDKLNNAYLAGDVNFEQQLETEFAAQTFPFDYKTIKLGYNLRRQSEERAVALGCHLLCTYRASVFDSAQQQRTNLQAADDEGGQFTESCEVIKDLWCLVSISIRCALIESKRCNPELQLQPQEIIKGIVWLAHINHVEADFLASYAKNYSFMDDELAKHSNFKGYLKEIATQQAASCVSVSGLEQLSFPLPVLTENLRGALASELSFFTKTRLFVDISTALFGDDFMTPEGLVSNLDSVLNKARSAYTLKRLLYLNRVITDIIMNSDHKGLLAYLDKALEQLRAFAEKHNYTLSEKLK